MLGGEEPYSYQWYTDGKEIAGEDDDELFITEDMIGKIISVSVNDADGNEATDVTSPVIFADESEEVSIIDIMGVQSDGTGILGDVLRVAYGVTFGTPSAVTWYRNGSAVSAADVAGGAIGFQTLPLTQTGSYMAIVTNKKGETYQTNTIEITSREEAAEILSFEIEDDYTDGTDITYNAQDRTAVATVTLAKNYSGTIGIYKKSDTKYTARVDSLVTSIDEADRTAAAATQDATTPVADEASELCSTPATNYQVLNAVRPGSGYGYIDNEGHVTYKFRVNDGALTRGTDYVVTFDQASIATDTPGTGKVNVFDAAVTVPYVQLPASIAVTKVSAGNAPEVTFYDENGNVLEWFATTIKDATHDTLAECGIASAQVYSATIKTNDTSKGTTQGAGTGNSLAQGVWTSGQIAPNPIDAYWFAQVKTTAGVFSAAQTTLTSEATPAAADAASDMDLIEKKGEATTATVSFSNLRSDGTVYIVRGYWDLATNGGTGAGENTGIVVENHATAVDNIFSGFDRDDSTTYVASAQVTAGTEKVDIENAISKYTTNRIVGAATAAGDVIEGVTVVAAPGANTSAVASGKHFNNNYIAVFIPDDETNYGMIYTDGALNNAASSSTNWTVGTVAGNKSSLQIRPTTWKYQLSSFLGDHALTTITAGGGNKIINDAFVTGAAAAYNAANAYKDCIIMKDQFGETITHDSAFAATDKTWTFEKTSSEGAQDNTLVLAWDVNGATSDPGAGKTYDSLTLTSTIGATGGDYAVGETWTAKTSTDQTLTLTCKTNSGGAGAGAEIVSTWTLSIS